MAQPIQNECTKEARRLGYIAIKNDPTNQIGLPDYTFIGWSAHIFFVEFKRPGEPLKPWQRRKVKKFADMGHEVYVIDNVDDFYKIPKKGAEPV